MTKMLKTFWRDESGAALVEYGVALLVAILVGTGGLIALANNTDANFRTAADAVVLPAPDE